VGQQATGGAVETPPLIVSRSHSLFSDSVTYYFLMLPVGSRASSLNLHILKYFPGRIKDGINEPFLLSAYVFVFVYDCVSLPLSLMVLDFEFWVSGFLGRFFTIYVMILALCIASVPFHSCPLLIQCSNLGPRGPFLGCADVSANRYIRSR
jgi:hypothetical protein